MSTETNEATSTTPLARTLADQGVFLFRLRSLLPVPLLALLALRAWWRPIAISHRWELGCLAIGLLGLGLRVWVAGLAPGGTSGRNTVMPRAERLNTTGPYSLVRHPLYIANFLMWLSPALFIRSPLAALAVVALFWFLYERIMLAEERFLTIRFGREYDEWASRTPAIMPALRSWQAPDLPFSLRAAIRREYAAFAGLLLSLWLLRIAGEPVSRLESTPDILRSAFVLCALVGFFVIRYIVRHTRLLHAPGR